MSRALPVTLHLEMDNTGLSSEHACFLRWGASLRILNSQVQAQTGPIQVWVAMSRHRASTGYTARGPGSLLCLQICRWSLVEAVRGKAPMGLEQNSTRGFWKPLERAGK